MKTLFVAAGDISWGSSRLRCYWPARYMNADVVEARVLNGKDYKVFEPYGAVVFQKVGIPDVQERLLRDGKQVWLDQCDPTWWFSPGEMRAMVDHCTGVVVSSQNLGDDFNRWSGMKARLIHDRLEFDHYDRVRTHGQVDPVRFLWHGVSVNRLVLYGAWVNLHRLAANGHNIALTIMDNEPERAFIPGRELPIYHVRWDLAHEVDVATSHDIALLPKYPGPWGVVKSANKDRSAMACGLPFIRGTNYEEMEALVVDHERRADLGRRGRQDAETLWGVERSAREWEGLLGEVL